VSIKRRTFIKGSAATGALALAVSAGLLVPKSVLAAWPENAFKQKELNDAIDALFGTSKTEDGKIEISAPEIAENGAVVPISVTTKIPNVQSIGVFVSKNPQPLTCSYDFQGTLDGFVSTRIKMGETSDIIAVVKAESGLFSTKKTVKVTIGGCGG